jgi:predicted Zn-dependent protease
MKILSLIIMVVILIGCQQPSKYPLGNQSYKGGPVGIYIMPAFGANRKIINKLRDRLEEKHELRVVVTTAMGLSDEDYDVVRKQYVANRILRNAYSLAIRYRETAPKVPIIIIIPQDMNGSEFDLRFIFSLHDRKHKISVVSLARINPINFNQRSDNGLVIERLEKLVNKGLGYHLYGFRPSSNRKSIMYGPIMGLEDLDEVENVYRR